MEDKSIKKMNQPNVYLTDFSQSGVTRSIIKLPSHSSIQGLDPRHTDSNVSDNTQQYNHTDHPVHHHNHHPHQQQHIQHHNHQLPQVRVTLNDVADDDTFTHTPIVKNNNLRRGSYFISDVRKQGAQSHWSNVSQRISKGKALSPATIRRGSNIGLLGPRKSLKEAGFDTFMKRVSRRRSSGRVNINARDSTASFGSSGKDVVDCGPTVDKAKCRKKFKSWMQVVTALMKINMRCKDRMWGSTTCYRDQIENIEMSATRNADDITHYSDFNPGEYKANKQMRMSAKAKEILLKLPEDRTEQEINYATIALRGISLIEDYPVRMQKKLAQYGRFECYEPKRPIVKQHHPPFAFYFILFGTVLVAIRPDDVQDAKTVVKLKRGESFGELSIMNGTPRQSTVITFEYSEFLSIDVMTYENLFMVGGSKNINDPDHNAFMESLYFLKHWPKQLLNNNNENVKFLFFNRDAVITKDSNYSDWIIIIKSGSVQVVKKLVKTLPTINVDTGRTTPCPSQLDIHLAFLSQSEDFRNLIDKRNKYGNDRLRGSRSARCVSVTPRIEDLENDPNEANIDKIARSQSAALIRQDSPANRMRENKKNRRKSMHNKSVKYVHMEPEEDLIQQNTYLQDNKQEETEMLLKTSDDMVQKGRRTFIDDLDSGYQKRGHIITEADRNPMFVHVQTLTKGDVFGLNTHVFTDQPSLCLISNGCECILIKKKLYFDNCPNDFKAKLKNKLSPYPDDGELQKDLLTRVNWDAYRKTTMSDLLHRQTMVNSLKSWV